MTKQQNSSLCWNAFKINLNTDKIEIVNIFELSITFMRGFIKQYKTHKALTEEFFENIRKELMYAYWAKFEYEIAIIPLIAKEKREEVVDIYRQVLLNWEPFKTYLLANEKLIKQYVRKNAKR